MRLGIRMVYDWYTDGIRLVFGGIRWYTGGIRWYTGGIRWYTGGIRMVYGWYTMVSGLFKEADLKIIPPNHQKLYEAKAP